MSAKSFFIGLSAGLAAGVFAQVMISRNREELGEMFKDLPGGLSLDELMEQKGKLEDLIKTKSDDILKFAKEKTQRTEPSDQDDEPVAG